MRVRPLVLASRSPQRSAILTQLGIPFRVVPSAHDESVASGDPVATAERNAAGKAADVLERGLAAQTDVVLGVDTIVVVDGDIIGKAAGEEEALAYLRRLNGRSHDVVSGLCLRLGERVQISHAVTSVTFRRASAAELSRYVACGEWRDRAGAYAVQGLGSALVAAVHGDYFNVVGLPVAVLAGALAELGLPAFAWEAAPA